ncbi:hypothetical protein F5X96DRAFT_140235 [Biscogniauxia mediterranea]|nr:hypothetical protein F5X96DRAFT_140235 [Biscogniauxia mediterranea]
MMMVMHKLANIAADTDKDTNSTAQRRKETAQPCIIHMLCGYFLLFLGTYIITTKKKKPCAKYLQRKSGSRVLSTIFFFPSVIFSRW